MHVRKQTFLNFIPVVSWYSKPYFIIVNLFGEKYIVSYYCVSKFAPQKIKICKWRIPRSTKYACAQADIS